MVIDFSTSKPHVPSINSIYLSLALILPLGVFPALAQEIKSTSQIDAVTIFPQSAQITRLAKISLEPGAHTLIFSDLPPNIIPNSIKVDGKADGDLEIGSIDTKRKILGISVSDTTRYKQIKDEIERLNDERKQFDNAIHSANTQISLLQNLAGLPATSPAPTPTGTPAKPQDWQQILNLIGGMEPLLARIHKAQIGQRNLDRTIKKLKKQLAMHQPRFESRTQVSIHVAAKTALTGMLNITYQVKKGYWTPFYEMRLNTRSKNETATMQLVRRASITQRTGENWENVTLTLSTTRPQASTSAPKLRPRRISFRPQIVARRGGRMLMKSKRLGGIAEDMMMEAAPAPMALARPKPRKARKKELKIISYGFQAIYQIAGRVTIMSGESGKKVRIASATPQVKLKIRTVPRRDIKAYLYADMKWNGKTALLPGRTSLFRDGAFTGSGSIPLINPGEDHELGFGTDDKIKVKRVQLARKKSTSGIISRSRVDVHDYKITVKNLHERDLPVTVIDQIPYSENEEIKVTRLAGTTEPTRTDDKDKRGILAWDFRLKAATKKEIRLNYKLEWPKDKEIVITPR